MKRNYFHFDLILIDYAIYLISIFYYLKELPEQWQTTKKLAFTVKQQVAPLQAAEVAGIRKKITTFDSHVTYYREVFKKYEVGV